MIADHGVDPGLMPLEEEQDFLVEGVDGRHRQLGGVETTPAIAAVAVQHLFRIDLTGDLEGDHKEIVDGDQIVRNTRLDMAFLELRPEALQPSALLSAEPELFVSHRGLQTYQPLLPGQ